MFWDIIAGWNTLKAGLAYVVVFSNQANSYTAFMTNQQSNIDNWPYIELEYEEGTVGYQAADGYRRCQNILYGIGWIACGAAVLPDVRRVESRYPHKRSGTQRLKALFLFEEGYCESIKIGIVSQNGMYKDIPAYVGMNGAYKKYSD